MAWLPSELPPFYLASASPRRRELLQQAGFRFSVVLRRPIEEPRLAGAPHEVALHTAHAKLDRYRDLADRRPVVTADTVVALDGTVLGKPVGVREAREMLAQLSGRTHEVYTAVVLAWREQIEAFVVTTEVRFRELHPSEIGAYLATGKALDKAGAYGIQDWIGRLCITEIRGSYDNVVGMPVADFTAAYRRLVDAD